MSKEDAVKFAGNLTVTDSDELIDTKGMDTWSDFAKDKTGGASAAGGTVSAAELPVHQAGDVFAIRTVGEDKDGNAVASDKIKAKVENVEISDDLGLLKEIPDEWKEAVGSDGKLKENHLSYIKSGDGVKELSKTVREEDVKQKLVHVTVTYTNDAEEEINHMLYMGTLTLMKQKDGEYQVYDPEEESGKDYDRVIGDGVARAGEMTYFSEKEEYGNGGNYVASLEPGESITLEMAWIVNEKNLKDMYLNLNGSGSAYGIEAPDMETGVVFIGKQ